MATPTGERGGLAGVAALVEATRALAAGGELEPTLESVVRAAVRAADAELGVVWLREREDLVARAVASSSEVAAAELEGLRVRPGSTAAALKARVRGRDEPIVLSVPLDGGDDGLGALELVRFDGDFTDDGRSSAALAADLAALAVRLCAVREHVDDESASILSVAGDALAASSADEHAGARIARLAVLVSGAEGALVWRAEPDGMVPAGSHGWQGSTSALQSHAEAIVDGHRAVSVETVEDATVVTLQLGQPPLGAVQLLFPSAVTPEPSELGRLASFAVRAAHALRSSERARTMGLELERSRALLELVSEAISRLSLSHTVETTLERLAELLGEDRAAVYLHEEGRLSTAAARSLEGPHEPIAAAVLTLALGHWRGRGLVQVDDAGRDPRLAEVRDDVVAARVRSVIALPLLVVDQPIGLLAVYPRRRRLLTPNESALLVALAAQLAVVVQNARLHERATRLGVELESALASEREAAGRVQALYEISRSFAQSLSLDATLDELAKSIVNLLGVDAAVIRMRDARGVELLSRAIHIEDERVDAAVRTLLARPQPLNRAELVDLLAGGRPLVLDAELARRLGGSLTLLAPFLEKGSSAAMLPIRTSDEVLATLTIVSLHPDRPIAGDLVETAMSIVGQAALAIDNARLYAQQKAFADAMQRSLLPREAPQLPGLELGDVYESSARVDVGGDVYDYLTLEDGRLAVVLGDVMGHGVDATADMAMAKFVFRSLARERVSPEAFLGAANDVVASEITPGKFITMVEVVIDGERGEVVCASAGHPQPRLVLPDGTVEAIPARGLALGIDAPQSYEAVTAAFPPGASVVLYTDGVIEARRDGEQFGVGRLDALLSESRDLPATEIAAAALVACRGWVDGDLTDDVAVVVVKNAARRDA